MKKKHILSIVVVVCIFAGIFSFAASVSAVNTSYYQNHNTHEGQYSSKLGTLTVDHPATGGCFRVYSPITGNPSVRTISPSGDGMYFYNKAFFSSFISDGWSYSRLKSPVVSTAPMGSSGGATIDFELQLNMSPINDGWSLVESPVGQTGFVVNIRMHGIGKEFYLCVAENYDGRLLITNIGGDRNDINNQSVEGWLIGNVNAKAKHRYTFKYQASNNMIYVYFDGWEIGDIGSPSVRSIAYNYDFVYCSLVNRNINAYTNESYEIVAQTAAHLNYLHVYNEPLTPNVEPKYDQTNAPYGGMDWRYVFDSKNISDIQLSGGAYQSGHYAIDIASGAQYAGTDIKAPTSGIVQAHFPTHSSAGNYVVLCTNSLSPQPYWNGSQYVYHNLRVGFMHMQNNSVTLNEGDSVSLGTLIGKVGNTGNVVGLSGVHLHLCMWYNDSDWASQYNCINPQRFFSHVTFTGYENNNP